MPRRHRSDHHVEENVLNLRITPGLTVPATAALPVTTTAAAAKATARAARPVLAYRTAPTPPAAVRHTAPRPQFFGRGRGRG